ncbi:hypothetical protein LAZ67_17001381 [Cordylochernes scorpioides]|uniref:Mos1 transposase HTH domain-containing protein n=1 Tax=Cordylochernes scorpioides TaxID=51811 RepID=A0ABY6LDE0_9ARAC|nr:hypothetical protein LAZ67_17001381 [Cordylochernes scorpioides]
MDQRTCIKFCVKNEIKCEDAFRMLTVAYGEATLDRSNVYRWYKMFSEGREDVNDEERAGCPSTSTTDEKINEVEKMILANRRITVREVAEDLNISIGSCWNSVRDDPNLLQRVITGDEAWVYGYDVETKAQSSQWKLPHEPRQKKARQVRSNVKVFLIVFFDCRGVVHHEFLPQGRMVNKEYYLQVMRNLHEAIRQKRPDLWKNKNWLLHHDNAPAHTHRCLEDAWCQIHPRETWTPVKISAQADSPQSFEVVTPSGNRLIRNQQIIRPRDGGYEKSQLSSEPITASPEAQHPQCYSPTMGESSTAPIQRSSEETNIDQREGATTSAGIAPEPSGRPRFSSEPSYCLPGFGGGPWVVNPTPPNRAVLSSTRVLGEGCRAPIRLPRASTHALLDSGPEIWLAISILRIILTLEIFID